MSFSSVKTDLPDLSSEQLQIMREFYSRKPQKVVFNKKKRNVIWQHFKNTGTIPAFELEKKCPALHHEISKAISDKHHIQSAVFSECVYAQTIADLFGLSEFFVYQNFPEELPLPVMDVLTVHGMVPRYIYKDKGGRRALIQAGGFGGTDSALIGVEDKTVFTIEFKEPAAKTSEPDLPEYGEDGYLKSTIEFAKKYPQFEEMLNEMVSKEFNIFSTMGSNEHGFSEQSIRIAVENNYAAGKFAHVICVEDKRGFLTMIPANHAGGWAEIRGELRPVGRNAYKVWTPEFLRQQLLKSGGQISEGIVQLRTEHLKPAGARGGKKGDITRYRFMSVFFVRANKIKIVDGNAVFALEDVQQIKPTISAHMFFTDLDFSLVLDHYSERLQGGSKP